MGARYRPVRIGSSGPQSKKIAQRARSHHLRNTSQHFPCGAGNAFEEAIRPRRRVQGETSL
jgi:hypothetical protein